MLNGLPASETEPYERFSQCETSIILLLIILLYCKKYHSKKDCFGLYLYNC